MKKAGVGKCAISQHPVTLIPMGHRIKARTHTHRKIIKTKSATVRPQESLGLWPYGSWARQLPHWEFGDFSMATVGVLWPHGSWALTVASLGIK